MSKRIVVWLTVKEESESDFNDWYQTEYIPRFVSKVKGIESVSRWKLPGQPTYLTVYDISTGTSFDEITAQLRDPSRDDDRQQWHVWETDHFDSFQDGIFEQVFSYTPSA